MFGMSFGLGLWNAQQKSGAPASPVTETPVISLATTGELTITCATSGATIYYTRNGDDPNPDEVWHPTNYPDSWTFEYDPDAFLQTKIPITFKAIAVKNDVSSDVATMEPEDMIKNCHLADVAALGGTAAVGDSEALDAEIAYIKANDLYDKIGYLISKDFGHRIGTDQTDPDARPYGVAMSFDDGHNTVKSIMDVYMKGNDDEGYKQRGTLFMAMGLLDTAGFLTTAQAEALAADGHEFGDHGYSLCKGYTGMDYRGGDEPPTGKITTSAGNSLNFTGATAHIANRITLSNPGVETPAEIVTVNGNNITVTLRYSGGITSTLATVKAAIEATPAAAALVTMTLTETPETTSTPAPATYVVLTIFYDGWGSLTPQEQYNELYMQDQAHFLNGDIPASEWFAPHGGPGSAGDGKPRTDEMWTPYMYLIAQHRRYNRPTGAQPTNESHLGLHNHNLNIGALVNYLTLDLDAMAANKYIAFTYTHNVYPNTDLETFLDNCATKGVPVMSYQQAHEALNAYCTKYINLVKRDFQVISWMDKYIPLSAAQNGIIVFTCDYAELGADPAAIVARYQGLGYDVAFWTDESAEAVACLLGDAAANKFMDEEPVTLSASDDWFTPTNTDNLWMARSFADYGSLAVNKTNRTPVTFTGTSAPDITGGGSLNITGTTTYYAAKQWDPPYTRDGAHIRIYASKETDSPILFNNVGSGLKMSTVNNLTDQLTALDLLCPQKMLARGLDVAPADDSYMPFAQPGGGLFADIPWHYLSNIVMLLAGGQSGVKTACHFGGTIDERMNLLYSCSQIYLCGGGLTGGLDKLCETSCPYVPTIIDIRYNNLTGSIPADIGRFVNVTTLNLHYNNLSGAIPTEIGNLSKLVTLNIGRNALTSYTQGTFKTTQTALKYIYMTDNTISSETDIDNIIADVLAMVQVTGVTGGALGISGTGMGTPSATGLANIATLAAAPYSWTIIYST